MFPLLVDRWQPLRTSRSLVRWRSEAMEEYQDRPYTQLGFILNLEEHWFTLRRFGPAEPDLSADPGIGHWFNLNSCVDKVEWVSRTYLGMVLQQAEAEGLDSLLLFNLSAY